MAQHHLSLAFVYKGWESYQQHLVTAIAALSPDQLALRASPQLRPVGEQVAHMIATRARWFFLDLREGGAGLEVLTTWDGWNAQTGWDSPAPPERTLAELVSGLQACKPPGRSCKRPLCAGRLPIWSRSFLQPSPERRVSPANSSCGISLNTICIMAGNFRSSWACMD